MDLETCDNTSPFAEGQDHSSLKALKLVVQSWAIQEIFEFKTLRANKTRWEVVCKGENCGWRIYATSIGGDGNMFRIKKYMWKHQCMAITHSGHKQATARYLGQWILPMVQQQPRYRPSIIVLDVRANSASKSRIPQPFEQKNSRSQKFTVPTKTPIKQCPSIPPVLRRPIQTALPNLMLR